MDIHSRAKNLEEDLNDKALHHFWSKHSRNCGISTRLNLKFNTSLRNEVDKLFPGIRHLQVLDVGTGAGFVALQMAMLGHDVTATDINKEMLDEARWNAERYHVNIDFLSDDIQNSSLEDGTFDLIILKETLFCLKKSGNAMRECFRILRPGGILLIEDGNYFVDSKMEEYARRKEYFKAKYGKTEMERMVEFCNIDCDGLREIVKDYVVNRARRPGWESWFLLGLGFFNLNFETRDRECFSSITPSGMMNFPLTYTVTAQKPYDDRTYYPRVNEEDYGLVTREHTEDSKDLAAICTALSNSERILMLELLLISPQNVKKLVEMTGMPQNLVSYNLKLLRNNNLIFAERKSREVYYSISDPKNVRSLVNILKALMNNMRKADDCERS